MSGLNPCHNSTQTGLPDTSASAQNLYLSHMLRSLIITSSCLLLLSSCVFHKKGTARKEKPRAVKLDYGMTHDEVREAVTDRSEVIVGEFNFPQGHMEAYQYARYGKAGLKAPKYYLYFLNDTLVRKSDPESLKKGSKQALRDHKEWLTERAEMREEQEALATKRAQDEERRAAAREEKDRRRAEAKEAQERRRTEHPEHKEKKRLFGKKKKKSEEAEEQQ